VVRSGKSKASSNVERTHGIDRIPWWNAEFVVGYQTIGFRRHSQENVTLLASSVRISFFAFDHDGGIV
jgi:hypothetical protein